MAKKKEETTQKKRPRQSSRDSKRYIRLLVCGIVSELALVSSGPAAAQAAGDPADTGSIKSATDQSRLEWSVYGRSSDTQHINADGKYIYYTSDEGWKTDEGKTGGVFKQISTGNWYYIKDGRIATVFSMGSADSFIGANWNGLWYMSANEDGDFSVSFDADNDILKAASNGDFNYLKAAGSDEGNGWFKLDGGSVDADENQTAAKNMNGWWYLEDGKVNFSYNGFAGNENGYWWVGGIDSDYAVKNAWDREGEDIDIGDLTPDEGAAELGTDVQSGKVNFDAYALVKDKSNVIDPSENLFYLVMGGQVDFTFTGFVKTSKSDTNIDNEGWWYVQNGVVDFTENGIYGGGSKPYYFYRRNAVDFEYVGLSNDAVNDIPYKTYCVSENENDEKRVRYHNQDIDGINISESSVDGAVLGSSSSAGDAADTIGLKHTWGGAGKTYWYINKGKVDTNAYGVAGLNDSYWLIFKGRVVFINTTLNLNGVKYTVDNGKVLKYSGGDLVYTIS